METLDTEPMVRAQIAPIANFQERTADRIGMELAAAIGVDPLDALRFFDKSAAKDVYQRAVSTIDSIADKNIIHKNKAARHKSRLNARIRAMQ